MLQLLACVLASALEVPVTAPAPRLTVVVASSESTVSRDQLRAIASEARRIWAPALDLDVIVPDGSVPAGSLIAIVTDRVLDARDADASALGAIMFTSPRTPLSRIVLSAGAAYRLAGTASWRGAPLLVRPRQMIDTFVANALGRALAHEIGHFVLRTPVHEAEGLMRAYFPASELMQPEIRPYAISRADRIAVVARFANQTAFAGFADERKGGRP